MAENISTLTHRPGYQTGGFVLFAASGIILLALAFEYFGGYAPCPLCLLQRYAYYAAIPLTFLALMAIGAENRTLAGILFLLVGLGFLANAVLGGYHAGVEWGWWPGPDTCAQAAGQLGGGSGGLLQALENHSVVSCADAAWRFLGLSFAGWNVVVSAVLGVCGLMAANQNLDQPPEIH
ncbi:MAG: disulfide bond formation protein B [Pseudomonadota bacterium]